MKPQIKVVKVGQNFGCEGQVWLKGVRVASTRTFPDVLDGLDGVRGWDPIAGHYSRTVPVSKWYRARALHAAMRGA